MSDPGAILGRMRAVADEQAENIQSSIDQVQAQIDEYNEEIDGVSNGLCNVISHDTTGTLTLYLDSTKLEEIELLYPEVPGTLGPVYIVYGVTYGIIDFDTGNVEDWEFRQDNLLDDPGPPPGPPDPEYYVRYVYIPGDDIEIDKLVTNFDFGNDYLTRPLTTGASYGLIPNRDNLISAKALLEQNKNKVEGSKTVFENYI